VSRRGKRKGIGGGAATIDVGRGNNVDFTNGYPDPDASGIVAALADTSGFSMTYTPDTVVFSKNGAPAAATCSVTYIYDGGASSTPAISNDTSGC
jgi:hypothetical protein